MAAKNQTATNKRKFASAKLGGDSHEKKRTKFSQSGNSTHDAKTKKKPFNSSKQGSGAISKPLNDKSAGPTKQNVPKTKREARLQAKELADARKMKRKKHYPLEKELAKLWEKMRRRNITKEDRSKLVTEALLKMKGKISEIANSHVSSRVLQTCIKYCTHVERDAVYEELQPHFLSLACNTHAVFLVKKLLEHASKRQLAVFISSLYGHVASLLRHMVGSVVVEHAYYLGNATQKQELVMELYSTELKLFKNLVSVKESRLVDIISKLRLQKSSVLQHMESVIQPILEKGILDHSIIHRVLVEYFSIVGKSSATDIIEQLSGTLFVRMIHTKDGSKTGILCVKYGSAKERKKIIKGMKSHITKISHDQYSSLVLVSILSVVDDTKLIEKVIIRELRPILKDIIMDKNGRRIILQLLHPNCPRYLSPDDLASLNSSIPSFIVKDEIVETTDTKPEGPVESENEEANEEGKDDDETRVEGGKKDPYLRRQELLINSGLGESLIDTCIASAGELLRSNFGREVIYEVAVGGADGILSPALKAKLDALHRAITSLAAEPKSEESEEEHVLENFHSSRTIRKLVLESPTFATTLWKGALNGNCEMWAQGHSSRVISAFLESSDPKVLKLAKGELQPLVESGALKVPENKEAAKKA